MSLIDRATELEYYPEQQLIQMSQDPQGQYPQFLVLSEIQRRNNMRRMYQNEVNKMNQPSTTVAEEAVMEFAGQGAVPMMDASSSLSSTSEGGLRSMAPIPMKSGKKTKIEKDEQELSEELREILAKDRRYEKQYRDYESGEKLLYPLVPRDYIVSDDEYNRLRRQGKYMREGDLQDYRPIYALLGALSGEDAPRYMPESKVKGLKAMLEATRKEKQMQQMGFQSGGSTALEQSFVPPMRNPTGTVNTSNFLDALRARYVNPDGTFNTAKIAKDGLSTALVASYFTPAGAIRGGLTQLGKGLFSLVRKPFTKGGIESIKAGVGRQAAKINPKMVRDPKTGKFRSQAEIGGTAISSVARPLGLATAVGVLQAPGEDMIVNEEDSDDKQLTPEQLEIQRLQDLLKQQNNQKDVVSEPAKKGLSVDDALTLAQIGGVFGGARSLGEAAMGLGNLAGQIQKTRREDVAEGLQGRLVEANIAKLEADIANMEPTQINAQLATVQDLIKDAANAGAQEELAELLLVQRVLNRKLLELRGISLPQGGGLTEGIPGVTVT